MRLWLLGLVGIILFLLGLAAGRFYLLVNLIWLAGWLLLSGLTILWARRLNRKIENMLSANPDPNLINKAFFLDITDFTRADAGLTRLYEKFERTETDHVMQQARYAGENLDLLLKSTTDPLTGLPNRKQMDDQMQKMFSRKQIHSVVMADIDHFKSVNDTYGHDAGDIALKQFAGMLKGSVRPSDYAFRYGGEEFILLCSAGINESMEIAERVRAKVEKTPVAIYDNLSITITASLGVAEYRSGDTPESLIKRADKALYMAKQSGRNRVCKEAEFR